MIEDVLLLEGREYSQVKLERQSLRETGSIDFPLFQKINYFSQDLFELCVSVLSKVEVCVFVCVNSKRERKIRHTAHPRCAQFGRLGLCSSQGRTSLSRLVKPSICVNCNYRSMSCPSESNRHSLDPTNLLSASYQVHNCSLRSKFTMTKVCVVAIGKMLDNIHLVKCYKTFTRT